MKEAILGHPDATDLGNALDRATMLV